jgi:hypothetical protein
MDIRIYIVDGTHFITMDGIGDNLTGICSLLDFHPVIDTARLPLRGIISQLG